MNPIHSLLLGLLASAATATAAPPAPETLTVETLPAPQAHWVYVLDIAFANENDARVHVFDADSHKRLGQVDAGFYPALALPPDGKTLTVATTYYARGTRGARTDVVEFTDRSTLATTGEVVLPAKHVMSIPSYFSMGYSSDGKQLYVSYITPAASFGVIDPQKKRVLSEIDTAGCVLVIPWGQRRVSSICDGGQLMTVSLDATGHETARSRTDRFFDAETDPIFVQGVPARGGYVFLSFLGQVHEVDLTGAEPQVRGAWSLLSGAADRGWRPGGFQIGAIHPGLGRLFVAMHRGGEGTHKDGGTEIWVFDLKTHQRVARWALNRSQIDPVVAVQVSQDAHPVLFAATETGNLAVLDALSGQVRHVEKHLGQTPQFLVNP